MAKIIAQTEDRILDSAYKTFLLFGYHGTSLQHIALSAGVNKSAVHYYFRSKDRLYSKVVTKVLDLYFDSTGEINTTRRGLEKSTWFLVSELYNNRNLFEKTLKEIYSNDWNRKLSNLVNRLQSKDIRFNIL